MKTIPIHEAKSTLSKLVQKAKDGETIYIGAFGKPEAVIAPLPKKSGVKFGTEPAMFNDVDDALFNGIDPEIQEMFYGKDLIK